MALAGRGDADVADAGDLEGVADRGEPLDQVRLNDGAGAAAHHRQVHHQTEGFPIHQVGGGAVVGTGEVRLLLDPGGATNPEPTARGQRFLFLLHPAQQGHFFLVQVAEFAKAREVALSDLVPAFAAVRGFAAVGPVEDRIRGRGSRRKVRSGAVQGAGAARGTGSRN